MAGRDHSMMLSQSECSCAHCDLSMCYCAADMIASEGDIGLYRIDLRVPSTAFNSALTLAGCMTLAG